MIDSLSINCPRWLCVAFAIAYAWLMPNSILWGGTYLPESGPFCGVQSLYGAMRILGHPFPIEDLADPKYIGSSEGSSIEQLKSAAGERGFQALPVGGLSVSELSKIPVPALLYVRSAIDKSAFDHWVLFLGMSNGNVKLIDAPQPIQYVPSWSFAPHWSGTALIISNAPVRLQGVILGGLLRNLIIGCIVIGMIAILRCFRRDAIFDGSRSRLRIFVWAQGPIVFGIACAIAIGFHLLADQGFMAHKETQLLLQRVIATRFPTEVTADELKLEQRSGAVVIDARLPDDYDAGHINGAISVPVYSTREELRRSLGTAGKSDRVIVYCQSSGCPYKDTIVRLLMDEGFLNVAIYREGWVGWSRKMPAHAAALP